jgi:poly [ADP-ribose] polymerase 2/3/4
MAGAKGSRKRAAADPASAQATQKKQKANAIVISDDEAPPSQAPTGSGRTEIGRAQLATSTANIPLDEGCPLFDYEVYVDPQGVIFDASLNQTNSTNNNNKFYRIQLLFQRGTYKVCYGIRDGQTG